MHSHTRYLTCSMCIAKQRKQVYLQKSHGKNKDSYYITYNDTWTSHLLLGYNQAQWNICNALNISLIVFITSTLLLHVIGIFFLSGMGLYAFSSTNASIFPQMIRCKSNPYKYFKWPIDSAQKTFIVRPHYSNI